ASNRDNTRGQVARYNIGVVCRAYHKALADDAIAEAFGFKRRVGADERIDGEDVVRRFTLIGKMPGGRRCAFQSKLFAGGPDKSYVTALKILAKRPGCRDQRGAANAIIKCPRRGAAAHQLVILLGNGDEVAGLDAESGNVFRAVRADIHVKQDAW